MDRIFLSALLALAFTVPGPCEEKGPLGVELSASGSLEDSSRQGEPLSLADSRFTNRLDLRLRAWGLSARAQAVDRRPLWENVAQGRPALGGGLYHDATGSRLLYGVQEEQGLPARLRNPWIRAIPFVEYHRPSAGDLRTEPSSTKDAGGYLYLGSPAAGPLRGFFSLALDSGLVPAYGWGLDTRIKRGTELRLEGFFTQRTLPARTAETWFSETPPLPERDFRLYGAGLVFTSPLAAFASDMGWSETFAHGRDLYVNGGLRLGDKPWRLSLAADGAGKRYVDREGTARGSRFRGGLRLERFGGRSQLFKTALSLQAPGAGELPYRSALSLYYRFPAPRRDGPSIGLSRLSLDLERNGSNPALVLDSLGGSAALALGPVGTLFQAALKGRAGSGGGPFPNPGGGYGFESLRLSGEAAFTLGLLHCTARLGYTAEPGKALWSPSLSASIRGKPGRLTLRLSSEDFPRQWLFTLSWRLHYEH